MTEPVSIRAARQQRDGEDLEIPYVTVWPTEQDFAESVVALARDCGWLACHFRPARTGKGWRTAIVGHIGFPDIVAVHPSTGRLVFAELKMRPETQKAGRPEPHQQRWLDALAIRGEVYVWRPDDYDREIVPLFRREMRNA